MAEEKIEPRGEWRMDLRFAIQTRWLLSAWAKKVPGIERLMPKFGEPIEQQTPDDMRRAAEVWAAQARAFGGYNRKPGGPAQRQRE